MTFWLIPALATVAFLILYAAAVYAVWAGCIAVRKRSRAIRVANCRDRSADVEWLLFRGFYARRAQEITLARKGVVRLVPADNAGHSVRVGEVA